MTQSTIFTVLETTYNLKMITIRTILTMLTIFTILTVLTKHYITLVTTHDLQDLHATVAS